MAKTTTSNATGGNSAIPSTTATPRATKPVATPLTPEEQLARKATAWTSAKARKAQLEGRVASIKSSLERHTKDLEAATKAAEVAGAEYQQAADAYRKA